MVWEPCSFFKDIFEIKPTLENLYLKTSNICSLHIKTKVLVSQLLIDYLD